MSRAITPQAQAGTVPAMSAAARPAHQAYWILLAGYVILPIAAGIDKFFHTLVNWDQYLSQTFAQLLPVPPHTFMLIVGGIEIAAGILVALAPRWGAYIVAIWLCGIIINLLLIPGYYDIALRDFGLAIGALALARLSPEFDRRGVEGLH